MRRELLWSALVGASMVLLAGCSQEKKADAKNEERPVKTVEVAAAKSIKQLDYSGSVKARYDVSLSFRVGGKILERVVNVGEHVKSGDLLARIDPSDYQLGVSKAEADLDAASRQVETYALNKRRAQSLFDQNVVSKSELDQRNLAYDQAVSSQKSATTALQQAKNQLSYTNLYATSAGIVTQVDGEPGQVVSAGSPVMTMALDGEKEVVIAVPETEISQFKVGKSVKAQFWARRDLVLTGTVREVAGSANAQSRTFNVRVSLPQNPDILLGMTATIEAQGDEPQSGFDLPLSAIAKVDGKTVVWVVNPTSSTVEMRPVSVGEFSATGLHVFSGVRAGDKVVAAGTQFMTEGMKIAVMGDDSGAVATTAGTNASASVIN
ncbi:efflux RND transporter periplasmic adaptor subunit [Rhizobium oryziradicis]|uniref:Efflux transporter periplasmic adaptor subunit n=1 Tax=Rhizobium oryziradicis TaxID=1867956 RepID=A0A1Q8ZKJ7_9HYPH|nr:efflux RND transporter periplasmic adaptor subunit [Rhizobium oryziradicis]OLP42385.1 efflux transporter periplasmic adaptor subunit [Rhizobium oryziradicis]